MVQYQNGAQANKTQGIQRLHRKKWRTIRESACPLLTPCALSHFSAKWPTQVMSRQEHTQNPGWYASNLKGLDNKTQTLTRISPPWLIPRSLVTSGTSLNTSPFICGFQDNVTNWMSSLVKQQDGCLQTVAWQASLGRLRKHNWHNQSQWVHREHHPRTEIKFNIFVLSWLTETLN